MVSKWWSFLLLLGVLVVVLMRSWFTPKNRKLVSSGTSTFKQSRGGFLAQKSDEHQQQQQQTCSAETPCTFALVADPDTLSKLETEPMTFRTYLMTGTIVTNVADVAGTDTPQQQQYRVEWATKPVLLYSTMNEGGRGLELSDLILHQGRLMSFDDRTGIVFEFTKNGALIAKHIITEGDGKLSAKGMKIEWATEKDNKLWMGSFGKEYSNAAGAITSESNFWVAILDEFGNIERKNWTDNYNAIRKAVGVPFPGYIIHEAINWSTHLQKWVIIPRRVSKEAYDDVKDEDRGANIIIMADEDFSNIEVRPINSTLRPKEGFSAFRFMPGSKDRLVLAVKSKEVAQTNEMSSCITIIDILTGAVLLSDLDVPHLSKYEGVEFLPKNMFSFPA